MPNSLKTDALILTNQIVTASGNSLLVNGNLISGGGGLTQEQGDARYITGRQIQGYLNVDVTYVGITGIVTGFSFNIGSNEIWSVDYYLGCTSSEAAGIKFGINAPVGAGVGGTSNGASTAYTFSTTGTPTQAVVTLASAGARVHALIRNAENTGVVDLLMGAGNGTVSIVAKSGQSYFIARKIS